MNNVNLTAPILKRAEEFYKAMRKFSELSMEALYSYDRSLGYVTQRNLQQECIKSFGIGYLPMDIDSFIRLLDITVKEDLLKLGVIFIHDSKLCSIMNDRIIFPICNVSGNIVSFSGRKMPDADPEDAKYVNTRNSQIFRKSLSLFGFSQALESIIDKGYCIVVEGNIDVMSLWQSGIKNVVAPCGTALTLQQLHILKRVCNNIVLWFDDDEAGGKALIKSYPMAVDIGFKVGCMPEQPWKDPDETLKNKSVNEILVDIDKSFYYTILN
jgi:DNA primase